MGFCTHTGGIAPAFAQEALETEKDMDRIELCKKNFTTLFGGEALNGQGNDPEMMDIMPAIVPKPWLLPLSNASLISAFHWL